jgi:hypothetical protein
MKRHSAVRRSTTVRLVLLATILGCTADQPEPTAVEHAHQATPLANISTPGVDPLQCTGYPEPRIWLESQAWWDSTGINVTEGSVREGEHIHVGMCWPTTADGGDAVITTDTLSVDVRVLLHNQTGKTHVFRVSDDGKVMQYQSFAMGPGDAERWFTYKVNLKTWPTGRREVRWTARIKAPPPDRDPPHPEMFNSTGWQLCVRSCTPTYRPEESYTEARGYYAHHDYKNARFLSKLPVAPVSGLWTFRIRLLDTGPGGVFVDPDFHNKSPGTVIRATGGPFLGDVTIDTSTLTNGYHRLVLVSSDGNAAGVQVIGFTVAN